MDCVFNRGSCRPVARDSSDDEPALLHRFQWIPNTSCALRDRSDSRIGTPCRWQNGWKVGMRPGAIMIGGVVIFKSGTHWVIRFDYRWMFSGGVAKLLPQKGDFCPASFGWAIAGGPVASLMFTVVCGLVALRYGNGVWGWIATLFWTTPFIPCCHWSRFPKGSQTVPGFGN